MVEKNGIHFIRVEPEDGRVISKQDIIIEEKKGKFIGREYVITEMDQIFPLFGVTLKRNEYFVIWRDPHFGDKNEYTYYLEERRNYLNQIGKMNAYFEPCTEKALEIIKRKKYNKIIIISSIGLDLSGKKFIEIARKILGFDVMVLFFSANNNHLKWIQNFPNALYTTTITYYEKYIRNYNEKGLLSLKKEIEKNYKISLKFTENFLQFPKYIDNKDYMNVKFKEECPYFKKVIIKNKKSKKALFMNEDKDRTVELVSYEGQDIRSLIWYVTLINGEITLFSNNSYLDYDKKKNMVKGFQFMKRWKYQKENEYYYFYYENNNKILTINGENLIVRNTSIKEDQLFDLAEENTEE